MAKKLRRGGSNTLNLTAENIGAALGHVAARIDAWRKQRQELAADIQRIATAAQGMLTSLGVNGNASRPLFAPKNKGGRPKGYKMSAATKAKLRAAWKRRKAAAGEARK